MSSFILAVDFETTGLDPRTKEIIQFGAVLLDSHFNELSEYTTLVRPRWPERGEENDFNVYEYTGISRSSLSKERTFNNVVREFELWLLSATRPSDTPNREQSTRRHLGNIHLFGQNVAFDSAFLKEEYRRIGMSYPFGVHVFSLESFYAYHKLVVTGEIPERVSLKTIAAECGVTNARAHSAISDIRTTIQCARVLVDKLKGDGG